MIASPTRTCRSRLTWMRCESWLFVMCSCSLFVWRFGSVNRISGSACCLLFVPSPSSALRLRHQPCGSLHRHLHNGCKRRRKDKSQPLPLFGPILSGFWLAKCRFLLPSLLLSSLSDWWCLSFSSSREFYRRLLLMCVSVPCFNDLGGNGGVRIAAEEVLKAGFVVHCVGERSTELK